MGGMGGPPPLRQESRDVQSAGGRGGGGGGGFQQPGGGFQQPGGGFRQQPPGPVGVQPFAPMPFQQQGASCSGGLQRPAFQQPQFALPSSIQQRSAATSDGTNRAPVFVTAQL